jgi:hypothetical protein
MINYKDFFGIEYPILQATMTHNGDWPLAAAISEAGGLGVISPSGHYTADWVDQQIINLKKHTSKPFSVAIFQRPWHVEKMYLKNCKDEDLKSEDHKYIIKNLEEKKQLTRRAYDPSLEVHTAWDLGVDDSTAIVFFQKLGNSILVIDYYENRREGLPHYVQVIKDKDYIYGEHYAPHDIEVTEFSTGKTRLDVAYQLGVRFRILPKLSLEDGIHSTKMVLPRCWFDIENTKPLIDALRQYHRKYHEKIKMFSNKPVKDWSSHAVDSVRYMAISLNDLPEKNRPKQTLTLNEYSIHGE